MYSTFSVFISKSRKANGYQENSILQDSDNKLVITPVYSDNTLTATTVNTMLTSVHLLHLVFTVSAVL